MYKELYLRTKIQINHLHYPPPLCYRINNPTLKANYHITQILSYNSYIKRTLEHCHSILNAGHSVALILHKFALSSRFSGNSIRRILYVILMYKFENFSYFTNIWLCILNLEVAVMYFKITVKKYGDLILGQDESK